MLLNSTVGNIPSLLEQDSVVSSVVTSFRPVATSEFLQLLYFTVVDAQFSPVDRPTDRRWVKCDAYLTHGSVAHNLWPICPKFTNSTELPARGVYSPNSTWLVTSRHDTTRSTSVESMHFGCVELVEQRGSTRSSRRARRVECVVSCRDVTWRAKWNLGLCVAR